MDFGDSIGISDIIAWRECPRRMSYGMRRHTGKGTQSDDRTPEVTNYGARYGSAIHEAIAASEDGFDDDNAIKAAWKAYGPHLSPGDIDLLRTDLETYRRRDFPNTRTIAAEEDLRVPLLKRDGKQIFFRFKLDRLYERIDAPGTFIHVDYKSSKWARSAEEVDGDEQMWAYNYAIHEYFPECERLIQVYDQLRYGQHQTRKTDAQRKQMHDWLVLNVEAILDDDETRPDGLLKPKYNRWCPWCPIMESCSVVGELSDFAKVRIAALAPTEKEGRKTVTRVVPEGLPQYIEQFGTAKLGKKVLSRFEDAVKDLMRDMTDDQLAAIGYERNERSATKFPPHVIEALAEKIGPAFWEAASITKTGLQAALADQPELLAWALEQGETQAGTPVLAPLPEEEPDVSP